MSKKLQNLVRSLCTGTYVTLLIYFVRKELKAARPYAKWSVALFK